MMKHQNRFKKKTGIFGVLLLVFFFEVNVAIAGTDTQTFQVKLTIISTCDIHTEAATDVDFGSQLSTATDITAVGELKINCTNGTAYNVGLSQGQYFNSGSRYMKNTADELVPYGLYKDSLYSQPWGMTIGTDTYSDVGNGEIQPVMVYGKVTTVGGNFIAGENYLDEVTATITY